MPQYGNCTTTRGKASVAKFGKHGIHKGTITSFDDDGELTFRVEYGDGDCEDSAEADVRDTLLDKMIRISTRSRHTRNKDDSESDYIDNEEPPSQATTQPMELSSHQATTQPLELSVPPELCNTTMSSTTVRRRSTQPVRQRSPSSHWVASPCTMSITIHYNAVDRGLCAQTLREHHTIFQRTMVCLYPRFKWGRSHYLQVQPNPHFLTKHACLRFKPHYTLTYMRPVVMELGRKDACPP